MKKLIPLILLVVSVSIYSCQKDHSAQIKPTSAALSKVIKDTTPPPLSLLIKRDTTPPPAAAAKTVAKDTTPPPAAVKSKKSK